MHLWKCILSLGFAEIAVLKRSVWVTIFHSLINILDCGHQKLKMLNTLIVIEASYWSKYVGRWQRIDFLPCDQVPSLSLGKESLPCRGSHYTIASAIPIGRCSSYTELQWPTSTRVTRNVPEQYPLCPVPWRSRKQEQEQELRAATPLSRSCSASQPASQRQRNPFCRIQTEINVKQNPIQFQFQSHPRAHCWAVMARGGKGRATSEGI